MKFNIFISGLSATGKTTLAKELSEKFGFSHFEIGSIHKRYLTNLRPVDDFNFNKWQSYLKEFIRGKASNGNSVIEGRFAGHIAHNDNYYSIPKLNILVTCNEDIRIQRYLTRKDSSLDRFEMDLKRMEELKECYGFDFSDKNIYDIIIDSANQSTNQLVTYLLQNTFLVT